MNVPFIRKWIAALRSGQYVQTTGIHRQDGKFCVLGVGYDLCPGRQWNHIGGGIQQAICGKVAPELLIQECGLDTKTLMHLVYHLNDNKVPFADIADYLESLLPKESFAQDLYERLKDAPLIEEVT